MVVVEPESCFSMTIPKLRNCDEISLKSKLITACGPEFNLV